MKYYYSEFDKCASAWLAELCTEGNIPNGHVDRRDIKDVRAVDVSGFGQCHFFAGIGGWPLAMQIAGWGGVEGVWTGSCPCQPYSTNGKRKGQNDPRDLWPEMFRLIRECRPRYVFGEQVADAVRYGWLDRIYADLEKEGYAIGAAVLGAHSVGAPHIRQRLYWGAGAIDRRLDHPDRRGRREALVKEPSQVSHTGEGCGRNHWSAFNIITCDDRSAKRIEPGSLPLADGFPGRLGLMRGYGNAIVPQVAAAFLIAFAAAEADWHSGEGASRPEGEK